MEKSKKATNNNAAEPTASVIAIHSDIPSARETVKDHIAQREAAQKCYEELVVEKTHLTIISNTLFDMINNMVYLLRKGEVKNNG